MDEQQRFAELYRAYHPQILRYLRRRLPAEDQVEDVCADVFVKAWRSLGQLRAKDRPVPWLYGIARHQLADHLRRIEQAHQTQDLLTAAWHEAMERSAEEGALDRVHAYRALAALAAGDREALMLTTWDGLAPADAAQVAGCSKAAFVVRLHRARRRLSQQLSRLDAHATRPERTPAP
ncbi:RNA polymerase sigma factor [Streptomyces sp. MNP-20]|uniref:RNA polymerase sigma factor n=1 Tax=Streptomyces sp. MNP-20 TaxID=2721165 RepID=UPI001557C8E7|nr:sigma-70 family RNA polymerase sigma factor [Streptomyces sp. MNP-20]